MAPLLYSNMIQSCKTVIKEFTFTQVFCVKLIMFTLVITILTVVIDYLHYCITLTYPVTMFTALTKMQLVKIFTHFFFDGLELKGFNHKCFNQDLTYSSCTALFNNIIFACSTVCN